MRATAAFAAFGYGPSHHNCSRACQALTNLFVSAHRRSEFIRHAE